MIATDRCVLLLPLINREKSFHYFDAVQIHSDTNLKLFFCNNLMIFKMTPSTEHIYSVKIRNRNHWMIASYT